MEESGDKQISLTDPDVKLMKSSEGFCVGYNIQTAVDADSHMIAGFQITNNPTDHGQITSVATDVKNDYDVEILETTEDKGYECPEDHAEALASGIVPNVIQRDGSCYEFVEFEYQTSEITDNQKLSNKPEDLKACLQAGIIPNSYKGILTDVEITEVRRRMISISDSDILLMSPDEMRKKLLKAFS